MNDVICCAKDLIANEQIESALRILQDYVESDENPASTRAEAWRLISSVSRDVLDLEQARHALAQAINLYRESGEEELELETQLLSVYDDLNSDRFMEAQHKCSLILKRAEEQKWGGLLALAYEVRAGTKLHRHQYQEALDDCLTAIRLSTEPEKQVRVERIALTMARSHASMGRFDLAKPYYEKSAAYFKRRGGLIHSLINRLNIGFAHYMAREYETAERIYKELLDDIKDLDRGFITSIVRQGLGMLLLTRGDFRGARKHLMISLQSIEQGEHRRMKVANLTALAIICVMLDEPREAINHATLSRDNCVELDDVESSLISYYLAIIYLANDNPDFAEPLWEAKRAISWSVQMQLEYEWMLGMLTHILAEDYSTVMSLSDKTRNLAEAWRVEVSGLSSRGCETSL